MVAGQVPAGDAPFHNVAAFPTEKDMASAVLTLPERCNGKYLGEGTAAAPVTEVGQLIKFSIDVGKWKFLKSKDTYSIVDTAGEPYAGGVYIKVNKSILGKERLTVYDENDQAIALAVQDIVSVNKKYQIFGTKPLNAGDAAAEKQDDKDFYPWFRVRDIDDNHLDYRSIYVWNGNNYMPMLKILAAHRLPNNPSNDALLIPRKGDNLVVDADNTDKVYALLSKKEGTVAERLTSNVPGWDICVAPGADPVAALILSAILDDMVGWFA